MPRRLLTFLLCWLYSGECVAQTTKDTMIILQALAGYISTSNQPKPYGSKIDLLAATCLDGEQYDLCSNEWKRGGVCDSILLKQQAKNLRTNAAILSNLIKLGCSDWMVAIDWAGVNGYTYTLSLRNDTFVAKPYKNLMIPKRSTQLKTFKNTLNFLFKWRNMLDKMAAQIDDQPNENPLRGIVDFTSHTTTTKVPTIIITPTLGKRKIDEVDQDNGEQ
ncbi:hypothetical protein BDB00DRAFT_834235 [Zychaea mexicana]|uniref:uncharacterized protein n=1 Tax=Zychaea mexicana TaxID=64656 RepID=UPI0022FE437A|nr:uncharacterized protein BDB00DRAFT_834235 [Zychaea mexicana]KAI9491203.1 hypothetical protein BDB00DRAFT_834235 [Zychaea mexicana]